MNQMETPDQYVHRAINNGPPVAGRECGWKADSTVSASRPELLTRVFVF